MSGTLTDVAVVVLFIVIAGIFVAAEIALVSLRDSQAVALASRGRRGRIVAELNKDPNRFLAGAQVGVTLAGFLSAALGGDLLAVRLEPVLHDLGLPEGLVETSALVLVTLAISYVSLVLGEEERHILEEVFEAGDRQLREVMLPRTEVDFLDATLPVYRASREALSKPHSRYPVIRGSADDVIGFVHVRDLLDPEMANRSVRVGELARDILTLPWTRPILAALSDMRREGIHMAMVADEYGGTAGIVTMEDLVEELVGDIKDEYDLEEVETTRNLSGDLEVDGLLNLDDFEDETGIPLPEGPYETVAGFLMARLGRIPGPGDTVEVGEHRITVLRVEGRRVSRVSVERLAPAGHREPDRQL